MIFGQFFTPNWVGYTTNYIHFECIQYGEPVPVNHNYAHETYTGCMTRNVKWTAATIMETLFIADHVAYSQLDTCETIM